MLPAPIDNNVTGDVEPWQEDLGPLSLEAGARVLRRENELRHRKLHLNLR
jgi:hypothetical protein